MKQQHLDVYNTHMELYPYEKDDIPVLEDMYTATEKFTDKEFPCGYTIDENGKMLLPRGTPISKVEMLAGVRAKYIKDSDPSEKMSYYHSSLYEPRNEIQEESINFLCGPEHQLGLNLSTGTGKAQPLSARILTPFGWTTMGEINIGHMVIGWGGYPVTVSGIFPQGLKDIYKVTLEDGRSCMCTLEHLWRVYCSNSFDSSWQIIELNELIQMNYNELYIPIFIDDTLKQKSLLKIIDISFDHHENAQCIYVADTHHMYVTDDLILTHNTYCVAYASTKLGIKTIIITPNEMLKNQWINTYSKMFEYRPKHLMNIAGSNIIDAIMEDMVNPADVYFVNHQTLRSYLMQHGGYQFHQFFKKLNVGIKVYDESHMEFANILMIDFFTNTDRTWYLTATFDRSDKTESKCFKRAFQSVICYGEMESKALTPKHVMYHVVNFDSQISPKNRAKLLAYPGYTSNRYGQYAFELDPNDSAYKVIREILLKIKDIEGKTLIFVPLIENVDTLVSKIKHDFPEKTVGAYHSKISKDEKESAEKKDIIVSTIKSCGTGRDIKGLRCVICSEPVASKVIAEQMIGRLRPYGDNKDTYFFDCVDRCIPANNWWFNARFKKIQTLVKDVKYLNIDALTFKG